MPDVLTFGEITDADAGRVGGKGLSLARMAAVGLPVGVIGPPSPSPAT